MIASLVALAAALSVGLPAVAIGERIREREESRLNRQPNNTTSTAATRKDTP